MATTFGGSQHGRVTPPLPGSHHGRLGSDGLYTAPADALDFAGGTGEPNDPYHIATAAQLISIGSDPNLQEKHFVLVADIDMDPNLPSGELLTYGLVLSAGSLDGGDHRILNLGGHVMREGVRRGLGYGSSLFESIGASAVVRDLKIIGVSLKVPALLAYENAGTVVNCSAEGTVFRSANWTNCGGLVANNSGSIIDCSVIGTVSYTHLTLPTN